MNRYCVSWSTVSGLRMRLVDADDELSAVMYVIEEEDIGGEFDECSTVEDVQEVLFDETLIAVIQVA